MASALKRYAILLKQSAQCEAEMKELRKDAKAELKTFPDNITTVEGVKFHMTKKLKKCLYPASIQKIIDDLNQKITDQKENAEKTGQVEKKYSPTFDAEILEPEKL